MLVLSLDVDRIETQLQRVDDFRGMFDILEVRLLDGPLSISQQQMLVMSGLPILLKFSEEMALVGRWELQPYMVDVPWQFGHQAIEQVKRLFPKAILQGSSHEDGALESIFGTIKKKGFEAIKIAQNTPTTVDVLNLLEFLQTHASGEKLTCVPVGEGAQFGRLLAPSFGSFLSFCCLPDFPTAAGQIDVATMHAFYSAAHIATETKRFGLIGNPVFQSPSHRTHTKLLRSFGVNGIYVKIPVIKEEVERVIPQLCRLGFAGVSVTTPLKGFLGNKKINTVKWSCCSQEVCNTDVLALFDAIGPYVEIGKSSVLLLGAGDVAWACCEALTSAGATVWVVNRTGQKADALVAACGGSVVVDLSTLSYDVIINATSSSSLPPISLRGVKVMAEFLYPQRSNLVEEAIRKSIPVVDGKELWARQAAKQVAWWCSVDEEQSYQFLVRELACRQ